MLTASFPTTDALTLRQKAGQVVMPRLGSNMPPAGTPVADDAERVAELLARCPLGGLVVFNGDASDTPGVLARLQAQAEAQGLPPLLVASDLERGTGQQVHGATVFPHAMAFGQAGEDAEALVAEAARVMAREARAAGVHVTFAPCADVNTEPRNPIIGTRAFSSDTEQSARMVAAFVEAAQAAGVSATAKHFPGHGHTEQDSHAEIPRIDRSRAEWERSDLPPFRAALGAGVDLVMTAHLSFPALDPTGEPATASRVILHDILRGELGFDGVVVTDSLLMAGASGRYEDAGCEAAALLEAGVDLLLDVPDPEATVDGLVQCVEDGRLSAERLDDACRRVLALKAERLASPAASPKGEGAALAERVAREALQIREGDAALDTSAPLTAIFVTPYTTPLDPPEQPLAAALRARFQSVRYHELRPGDSGAAYSAALADASGGGEVLLAYVVKPAAWHAFGLGERQRDFVRQVQQASVPVLVALGAPIALEPYADAPARARLVTYSDVAASQRAVVGVVAG